MNAIITRGAVALALGGAALAWGAPASAQAVVVQPGQTQAPAQPQPPAAAPQNNVVVSPGVTQAQAPSPAMAPAAPEEIHPETRPNRALLMTGLVAFGAPYVASMGIAATSSHAGDGNLWIPVLGPWLDLGQRGGCGSGAGSVDCGQETGNKVLLIGDGILQTFGALEIAGAFIWPEIVPATTVGKADGPSVSFTPAKVGYDAYGLSAVGKF